MRRLTTLALSAIALLGIVLSAAAAEPQPLPWQREMPLCEAAQSVTISGTLAPINSTPGNLAPFGGSTFTISSLKMRTILWGPPNRITISLTKNNVWDRRLHEYKAPTLREIIDGANSPTNKSYVGVGRGSLRPKDLGWLDKDKGAVDPYRRPMRYAFPCMKPVGQIIIGIDALAGTATPAITQNCADGLVTLEAAKGDAKAKLQYILGMTSDMYAIRGDLAGITAPVTLRLYRHRDTSHLNYMAADGKTYTDPLAEADKAFNGPIDPPTSGQDGRYFWIRQRMPAEKTFPQGFEYVLMGVLTTPGEVKLDSVEGKTGLGTPPANQPLNGEWHNTKRPAIADAPGAAATATLTPAKGKLEALVTVVTTMDGADIMAVAKKRLADAVPAGFDGVLKENTKWWNDFYDLRENGRVFTGSTGAAATDDIRGIFRSWTDGHGGGTKTDMRKYECSAGYAVPERDFQEWDSRPCYNEIFTTAQFVRNRADNQDMWKQIVWHWMPAAKLNAKELYNAPGMCIVHGYLPPVKPDKYVHTTITLEFCLDTMGQVCPSHLGRVGLRRRRRVPPRGVLSGDEGGGDLLCRATRRRARTATTTSSPRWNRSDGASTPGSCTIRTWSVRSAWPAGRWCRAADAADFLEVDAEAAKQWREVARAPDSLPHLEDARRDDLRGQPRRRTAAHGRRPSL